MMGKTVEIVRCCAALSGMGIIGRRNFAGFNKNRIIDMSFRNIVGVKPVTVCTVFASAIGFKCNRKRSCSFTTHATGDSTPIDSPLINSMQLKIKELLDAESVTVTDAYGDGRHVSISVVSAVFEGKSQVNRQRMVYKAIWEELQTTVHAVDQMTTKTPQEAAAD